MSRYVVIIEQEGAEPEVFGPWYTVEKAAKVAEQLRPANARYTGDPNAPIDARVSIANLYNWPGVRRYLNGDDNAR